MDTIESSKKAKNQFLYFAIVLLLMSGVVENLGGWWPIYLNTALIDGAIISFIIWATKPKSKKRTILVSVFTVVGILIYLSILRATL